MVAIDPIVFRELPVIQKIIADETWLEGERRGCYVAPDDPVVRENVCRVILRIGAELRATLQAQPASPAGPPASVGCSAVAWGVVTVSG
jgi:hypothetical protein